MRPPRVRLPVSLTRTERGRADRPRSVTGIALFKGIGGDGTLQLGPDVSRITGRCGGDDDAAD
jgi:hypothetical protein